MRQGGHTMMAMGWDIERRRYLRELRANGRGLAVRFVDDPKECSTVLLSGGPA